MNGIADHTSRKHVKHFFFKNIVYKNIKSIAHAQFFCIVQTFCRQVRKFSFLRKTFLSYVKHSCCRNYSSQFKEPSIKLARSDFVIQTPHTCTSIYAFNIQPLLPTTSVQILFFKETMTDIFCQLPSIKEPQTTSQNKETTLQSYRKMSIQNTKTSLGIEVVLLTVRERWGQTILVA